MPSSLEDIRAHNERIKKDREAQEKYMKKQEGFGLKYDTDKLRWDLLDLKLIKEIVKVYSFGAKKYTDNSWQQVENAKERYYAAMMRHLEAYRAGEKKDPESGLLHTSHIGWNALALIHFDLQEENEL